MNTTALSPKVTAAAGGGASGLAAGTVLVWLLQLAGLDVPEPVAAAIGALCATGLATLAGYLRRDPLRDAGQAVVAGEVVPREEVAAVDTGGDLAAGDAAPAGIPAGAPVDVVPDKDAARAQLDQAGSDIEKAFADVRVDDGRGDDPYVGEHRA